MRHCRICVLALMMGAGAALTVPLSFGWPGAHAQVAQVPTGHRQPKAAGVPTDSSQKVAPRSPEDIALERALNNICRGCSPVIQVRNVPRYGIDRTCPASDDSCRKDEETARDRLKEQWSQFSDKARSDCVQTNEIGGRPTYLQLIICLRATQIAPTLSEGGKP